MLYRDLKKIANECCINPKKLHATDKITFDVGNTSYWITKAIELLTNTSIDSFYLFKRSNLIQAIKLLIYTIGVLDEEHKKSKETGNHTPG